MIKSDLPRRHNSGAYFRCKHSREWISMLAKCDDIIDCLDASDEVRCLHGNIGNLFGSLDFCKTHNLLCECFIVVLCHTF
jgi:hypothetical protein